MKRAGTLVVGWLCSPAARPISDRVVEMILATPWPLGLKQRHLTKSELRTKKDNERKAKKKAAIIKRIQIGESGGSESKVAVDDGENWGQETKAKGKLPSHRNNIEGHIVKIPVVPGMEPSTSVSRAEAYLNRMLAAGDLHVTPNGMVTYSNLLQAMALTGALGHQVRFAKRKKSRKNECTLIFGHFKLETCCSLMY